MWDWETKLCLDRNSSLWIKTRQILPLIRNKLSSSHPNELYCEDLLEVQKRLLAKCLSRFINTRHHHLKFLRPVQEREVHKLKEFKLRTRRPQEPETFSTSKTEFQMIQVLKSIICLYLELKKERSIQVSTQLLPQTLPRIKNKSCSRWLVCLSLIEKTLD